MKTLFYTLLLLVSASSFAQKNQINIQKGYGVSGYDVVSYFDKKPKKGIKKYTVTHKEVNYKFSSQKNATLFKKSPNQYLPQYGGYCAYAIGKSGKKVSINPKTFLIKNHKLYLFYNKWGTNTLKMWNNEGALKLQKSADIHWEKIKKSS